MSLFLASQTLPFGIALFVMLGLGVIELIGLIGSFSVVHMVDHFAPDVDADGPLGWLHIGRTPMLVLIILFLAGFGVGGYLIQGGAAGLTGAYLPALVAVAPATVVGVAAVRMLGGAIGRIIPKDETAAVGEQQLVGRTGVVIRGVARRDLAAEARVRDVNGAAHYLMVEPDVDGETLEEGADILIVRKVGVAYRAIPNPHPAVL